jgi:putative FmdB family regulatory protein
VPTYQYVCTECGGQLEAVQKFTDEPLTVHESCGGRLRKVFSPAAIVFKGSGFYRNDSRGSGSSSAAKPGSDSASTSPDTAKPDTVKSDTAKSGGDPAPSSAAAASSAPAPAPKSSSGEKVA